MIQPKSLKGFCLELVQVLVWKEVFPKKEAITHQGDLLLELLG